MHFMRSSLPVSLKFMLEYMVHDGKKVFLLRNVTSHTASNMKIKSFELIREGGERDNILSFDQEFPNVLGPNEQVEIEVSNRMPSNRPGLAKELELVFLVEDENYMRYCCIASKNVENFKEGFGVGSWVVNVKRENELDDVIADCADSVLVALSDAEEAIQKGKYESAVDRLHTTLHGYVKSILDKHSIATASDENLPNMFSKLCKHYELTNGIQKRVGEILKSGSGMVHYINEVRNKNTPSHPNHDLIQNEEALLVVRLVEALFEYIAGIEKKDRGKQP